jgi:protein TonB
MEFSAWTQPEHDSTRRLRLAFGAFVAVGLLSGVLSLGVAFGSVAKPSVVDPETQVKFVRKSEAKPTPAPPKPVAPPPAAPRKASPAPQPPPLATAQPLAPPPTVLPKDKPVEADPSHAVEAVAVDQTGTAVGSIHGVAGGTGTVASAASGESERSAGPSGPIQLPEDATPPEALEKVMPSFTEDMRAALTSEGKSEVVIVVKFSVEEDGTVKNLRILRGHPAFDAAVMEAVSTWTFKPATSDGKVIAVWRTAKLPFRIRT